MHVRLLPIHPIKTDFDSQRSQSSELRGIAVGGGQICGASLVVQTIRAVFTFLVPSLRDAQVPVGPFVGDPPLQSIDLGSESRIHQPIRAGALLVFERDLPGGAGDEPAEARRAAENTG